MTCSLRTYSNKSLIEWINKLEQLGDDISIGSADRMRELMQREKELLYKSFSMKNKE